MTSFTYPKADELRTFAITQGYREQYNETLWDWLTANGYTQGSLQDKIHAAELAGFTFSLVGTTVAILTEAGLVQYVAANDAFLTSSSITQF